MNSELMISNLIEKNPYLDSGNITGKNLDPEIEYLTDKIQYLEAELHDIKEKLSKIERVMPWVSETFDMDENKDM